MTTKFGFCAICSNRGSPQPMSATGWYTRRWRARRICRSVSADPMQLGKSDREPSDILLMSPSIAPLPALCALARDSARRKERRLYAVIAPNLVCVAGAFAFGFTPMAAVLLSNFGTSVAYNGAKRALREAEPMRLDDACYADEEPVRSPSLVPKTERAE